MTDRAPGGVVLYSHAGDDWRECRDYIRQKLGLPDWQPGDGQDRRISSGRVAAHGRSAINAETDRRLCATTDDEIARINLARDIWRASVDLRNTLGEKYLCQHRALKVTDDLRALRFHPACPWRDEATGATITVPAVIAAFRSIDNGEGAAVHRIRLDADGNKIDRRMLGVVYRAAVMLDVPRDGALTIGEGIETAMAGRQLGLGPAWALGSVGAIARFPVLEGINQLRILGETGLASARAIEICRKRWIAAGRTVIVTMPDAGCDDLNDELMRASG